MTTNNNVSAKGQQHTEQPEFINEGEIDQNAEQCHDTCPLPAKLTDDKTIELSNQLLESENVCLKKTVAQCQKDFAKLEAHCINLELQMENNVLKSGQQSQFLKEKGNEAKVNNDIDEIETIKIELEHSNKSIQSYKGRTQSLVAEKTDISENRASRNFDLMINKKTFDRSRSSLGLHGNDAPFLNVQMTSVHISSGLVLHQMTSDHNRSELRIHDHSNEPSHSKLVPKVVPLAVKTATSRQELELLFHHHIAMLRTTGATPAGTPESLISLSDLSLNMADLTFDSSVPKKTRPSVKVGKGSQKVNRDPFRLRNHLFGDCFLKPKCSTCGFTDNLTKENLEHAAVKKTLIKLKAQSPLMSTPKNAPMA
ncbi:hypothetical protein Tco_1057420 [Tanacetum coccineum]|uniref:Uncharacterized protein n=1 Tax=Tanacetum coccineum TaxID=301880 RepID=A0ABQ5H7G3_9ASTR